MEPIPARSVDLDSTVDFPNKEVGGVEAYGPRQEPEGDHHDHRVAEVQQGGNKFCNFQLKKISNTE